MTISTSFCFLNYCGELYALIPEENAGTDQLTGEYRNAVIRVKSVKGNIENNTNDAVNRDINKGELRTADKTLYTYYKLPLNTFICVMPPSNIEGEPELFQIKTERNATYFMYRIIGELRYSYDMDRVTNSAINIPEFQKFLESGQKSFGSFTFESF